MIFFEFLLFLADRPIWQVAEEQGDKVTIPGSSVSTQGHQGLIVKNLSIQHFFFSVELEIDDLLKREKLSSREIDFQRNWLPEKLSSREIVFQRNCLPGKLTSREIVFQRNYLPEKLTFGWQFFCTLQNGEITCLRKLTVWIKFDVFNEIHCILYRFKLRINAW